MAEGAFGKFTGYFSAVALVFLVTLVAAGVSHSGSKVGSWPIPITALENFSGGTALAGRSVPMVPVPRVRAEAAIILDPITGETIWEQNSRELRSIASITKVI